MWPWEVEMDERIFPQKRGQPVPEWNRNHRLPTDAHVGPLCADDGTVFRINSKYMDVSDQPFTSRQWAVACFLIALVAAGGAFYISILPYLDNRLGPADIAGSLTVLAVSIPAALG